MTARKPRPEMDLVPLREFSERIATGWTMVPGYPLSPGDYAVLMAPPGYLPPKARSNRSAGSINRPREAA